MRVYTRIRTGGSRTVEIGIEDNGPGMDEQTLNRIFEPDFTTKSGGTGLGLPIVRKIMDDHEGDIHIDSGPGRGTRVTLIL